jgi:hypothetical protein
MNKTFQITNEIVRLVHVPHQKKYDQKLKIYLADPSAVVVDDDPRCFQCRILAVLCVTTDEVKLFDKTYVKMKSETDSFQIRPKRLFCNKKGYYFKNSLKRIQYLTVEDIDRLKHSKLGKLIQNQ